MSKNKINNALLVVGITSKHIITGVSVAFEAFLEELNIRSIKYIYLLMPASECQQKERVFFSIYRLTCMIFVLVKVLLNLRKTKVVYVTMASSQLGFLRDFGIILMSKLFRKKLIFHLHGGGYMDFYRIQFVFY